ncbi:MAG TPA: hypothetical protein DCZ11_03265 [Gammaproteobacteria bacterium]|nr:hypothetical protein [Gammaproteobacteria bacterium]MCH77446.1 hypothetical protein [Gammaproteobacteria bacterium]
MADLMAIWREVMGPACAWALPILPRFGGGEYVVRKVPGDGCDDLPWQPLYGAPTEAQLAAFAARIEAAAAAQPSAAGKGEG